MGCCGWGRTNKVPTVPPLNDPSGPVHLVAHHRSMAEVALVEAAGGAPLCRSQPAGSSSTKHAEGRLAAVAELQRRLRRTELEPRGLALEALGRWRARLYGTTATDPQWRAYHEGGIAELEAIVDDLGRERSRIDW